MNFDLHHFMLYCPIKGANKMSETITIRLSEKLQQELKTVVRLEKTSKSEIIRDAVTRYLAVKRFKHLQKQLLPFAKRRGLLIDKDIFKAIS